MSPKAYAQAGVDIDLADRLLEEVKPLLKKAVRPGSLGSIGGFGGLFDLSKVKCAHPVLVSSTDGVGTKVKVAAAARIYSGLGHDIVNHCSNDIAVCGAEPLYFLDYYATSKLEADAYIGILKSLASACIEGNIALVGGETAEMPGVYGEGEFDLVGTIVGVVNKKKILSGSTIRPGDQLIGLASTGLHTNGFSLARRICFQQLGLTVDSPLPGSKTTLGKALLAPHRNYSPLLQQLFKTFNKAETSATRVGNQLLGRLAAVLAGLKQGHCPKSARGRGHVVIAPCDTVTFYCRHKSLAFHFE